MPSQPVRIRHRFRKPPAHSEPALRLPLQQQAAIRRLIAAVKINCERSGIKTRPLRKESGSRSSAMPAYINLPTDWTCQLHSKWARAGSRFDVRHKRPIQTPPAVRGMSASPPIASALWRRSEMTQVPDKQVTLHGCARGYFWFHSPAFHFASGQISGTSLPLWVQGSTVQSSLVLRSLITAVLCGPSVNRNRDAGAAIV